VSDLLYAPATPPIGGWADLEPTWTFLGSTPWQGVEFLIIKPIEFDVCDINSYYKNCNEGAI